MRIMQNITAYIAHRHFGNTNKNMDKNLEKLSSGYRINRAADDAAGLAVSEKMRTQVNGLDQARRNALDGVSLVQTAEAAMHEMHTMLQRMRTLAVQTANGTYTSTDRNLVQTEVKQLIDEIDRLSSATQFNELNILKLTSSIKFHIGANKNEIMAVNIGVMSSSQIGIKKGSTYLSISTIARAESAIFALTSAINAISVKRANLGAVQNRLDYTLNALGIAHENMAASEARIRDLDMAKEMMDFTKNQILMQAGTSMLAQANQVPQSVLALLG
ncbi:flagellin [bacterium]|nr:flagellin [bacterium]MBU1154174.1 flagellin [bacterium]